MSTLDDLAEQARLDRPRLFAVYGLCRRPETPPILGWGMEFEGRGSALFHLPRGPVTHHTVSAERVARRYALVGEMHLEWYDDLP
jgi:hypothetical protein